jgi:hypothetical protein
VTKEHTIVVGGIMALSSFISLGDFELMQFFPETKNPLQETVEEKVFITDAYCTFLYFTQLVLKSTHIISALPGRISVQWPIS